MLATLDEVRSAPAMSDAKKAAPDVYAEGDRLRKDAQLAYDAGDVAGAQILGEQALAAYEEAVAVARAVRAEQQRVAHAAKADEADGRLATLEADHQKVAAEIAALEKRLAVLQTLTTPAEAGEAKGARVKARAEATRTLALQARLLCLAGDLLASGASKPASLTDAKKALGTLDEALAAQAGAKDEAVDPPLDLAMRTRAACLLGLTEVRRSKDGKANRADALLDALGDSEVADLRTGRDERGVTVTLHEAFDGAKLSASGQKAIEALSGVAKRFPAAPLMVVLHQNGPLDDAATKTARSRGATLVAALRKAIGNARVADAALGGNAQPLVDPDGAYAAQNDR
ncbi:MAG: hypothetical protein AAFU70_13765, partial [Planctomycetota bacterium]